MSRLIVMVTVTPTLAKSAAKSLQLRTADLHHLLQCPSTSPDPSDREERTALSMHPISPLGTRSRLIRQLVSMLHIPAFFQIHPSGWMVDFAYDAISLSSLAL